MKKLLFLLFFASILSHTSAGTKSWYKLFTGKIDSYPITMTIVKFGEEVRGYYYYDKYKKPIEIFGSTPGDSIRLVAYISAEGTENFDGVYKQGSYTGKWSTTTDNKEYSFTLTEDKTVSGEMEFVYVKGEERLFKDLETPSANYLEGTFWPTEKYDNAQFVRNSILKMKNKRNGLNEIGDQLLANKKKFMEDFRDYNAEVKRDDVADGGWSYSLESIDLTVPVFFNERLFVYTNYNYSYTGGAHGNYGTGYYNLDLKRRKVLELDDIISKKDQPKLSKLLEKYYKIERGYPLEKTLQEIGLFIDTIPVNNNFAISPAGIMFDYVPYEISSYAEGEITISIPYEEISAFIKPDAKELFKQ